MTLPRRSNLLQEPPSWKFFEGGGRCSLYVEDLCFKDVIGAVIPCHEFSYPTISCLHVFSMLFCSHKHNLVAYLEGWFWKVILVGMMCLWDLHGQQIVSCCLYVAFNNLYKCLCTVDIRIVWHHVFFHCLNIVVQKQGEKMGGVACLEYKGGEPDRCVDSIHHIEMHSW